TMLFAAVRPRGSRGRSGGGQLRAARRNTRNAPISPAKSIDSPAMSTIMASRALLTAVPCSGRARGTTRGGTTRLPVPMLGEFVQRHDAQHDGQVDERCEEQAAGIGGGPPPPEP